MWGVDEGKACCLRSNRHSHKLRRTHSARGALAYQFPLQLIPRPSTKQLSALLLVNDPVPIAVDAREPTFIEDAIAVTIVAGAIDDLTGIEETVPVAVEIRVAGDLLEV